MTYAVSDFSAQILLEAKKFVLAQGEAALRTQLTAISSALASDNRVHDNSLANPPAALDPRPIGTNNFTQGINYLVNRGLGGGLTQAQMKTAVDALTAINLIPPSNTVAPVVSGTVTVGQTLSCTQGTWTDAVSYSYQWERDGSVVIPGATNATYVLVAGDSTHTVGCEVTATNVVGSTRQKSNFVGPVP